MSDLEKNPKHDVYPNGTGYECCKCHKTFLYRGNAASDLDKRKCNLMEN